MRLKLLLRFQFKGIALLMALIVSPLLSAQSGWEFQVNQYGFRKAFIQRKALVLGANCSTRLQFNCIQDSKGATGMLALEFTVSPIAQIKGFDFGYFEGPGAPVAGQKLMRLTTTQAGKPTVHSLTLGGWLSAEIDDGFVFSANNRTRHKTGQVRKVLDQVLKGAESLEVAIIDGKNHSLILKATFPLAGSRPTIESLLKGI